MTSENRQRLKNILFLIACAAAVVCLIILLFFRTSIFSRAFSGAVSVLNPFIYGAVIAYLLHPVCSFFEKWLMRLLCRSDERRNRAAGMIRMISILLSLLLLFAVLMLLLLAIGPQLIVSVSNVASRIPSAVSTFEAWIQSLDKGSATHDVVVAIQNAVDTLTQRLQAFLQQDFLPTAQSALTNITSSFMDLLNVLKNFGLGCIISSYLLGSWERFGSQARLIVYSVFPQNIADWIRKEAKFTDQMFTGFIHGKLLDSLIVGLICFVFVSIVGMPYAMLISVIVGVTNIIPFFGPYLGAIPSALLILTISPVKCLVFLVFIIILQQVDGNVLGPMILGDRVGLSGIWILFSILVFSSLMGLPGMLVGVPLFAVIYDLIRSFVFTRLQRSGQGSMVTDYRESFPRAAKEEKKPKIPRISRKAGSGKKPH